MKKRIIVFLLLAALLFCTGCSKRATPIEEPQKSAIQIETGLSTPSAEKPENMAEKKAKTTKAETPDKPEEKSVESEEVIEEIPEEPAEEAKKQEKAPEETQKKQEKDSEKKEDPAKPEKQKEEENVPEKKDNEFTSSKAYYVKVNCQMNTITVYTKDKDGHFTVPFKAMVCSTGADTPLGKFDLNGYNQWQWLSLVGGVCGQYCTQIRGNYLFHSVPYTTWQDKGSLQPGEYDKLGTSCSHGCIRLTVADALWVYNNKSNIALVEIYNSSDPGPLGKPYAQKISGSQYAGWDPTDPDPSNPWHAAEVTVGNYVGMQEAEAVNAASSAGLKIGSCTYQYSDSAAGTVLTQSLTSGSSVKQGSEITFTISKGLELIEVGNYLGMTETEAVSAAANIGLNIGNITYQDSDSAVGTVLAQSLTSGSSVAKGTAISFTVSQAKTTVSVGTYTGMSVSQAQSAAEAIGLAVSVEYQDGEADNIVIAQSIAPGTDVSPGSSITLTVSRFVEQTPEPEPEPEPVIEE